MTVHTRMVLPQSPQMVKCLRNRCLWKLFALEISIYISIYLGKIFWCLIVIIRKKKSGSIFFLARSSLKTFSLISQTRIVLVTFCRDPLVIHFDLSISFSKPLFTRIAFLKYIQNNKECLTFQLILLKEDIVCCIHLFCRAFLKIPITPLSIHIWTSQKRRKITCIF